MTNEKEIFILEGREELYECPNTLHGDFDGDELNFVEGTPSGYMSQINYIPGTGKSMFAYTGRPYQRLILPIHPIVKKEDRKLKSLFNEEKLRWESCLYQTFPLHYVVTYKNSRMEFLRNMGLWMAACDPVMDYYLRVNYMLQFHMPRYNVWDTIEQIVNPNRIMLERYDKRDKEITNNLFKTFTPIVIDSLESSKPSPFVRTGRAYPTKGRK